MTMRIVEATVAAVADGKATVDVSVLEGGCGRCHEIGGCGSHNLAQMSCSKSHKAELSNSLGAKVGDRVAIGIDRSTISTLATRFYVVPLLFVMAGAAIGQTLTGHDASVGAVIGAAIGLGICLVLFMSLRAKRNPEFRMLGFLATSAGKDLPEPAGAVSSDQRMGLDA